MKRIMAFVLAACMLTCLLTCFTVAETEQSAQPDTTAQSKPALKISGYPRLYFTAEEKQVLLDRAKNEDPGYGASGKDMADAIIAAADQYLDIETFSCTYYGDYTLEFKLPMSDPQYRTDMQSPPPTYTGGAYPYWTLMSRSIENRLKYLALAYVLTDNAAYADRAISYVVAMSDWEKWTDNNYGDGSTCLDTAHLTFGATAVYDFCYDRMTDEQRDKIKNAILTKSIEPLAKAAPSRITDNTQVLKNSAFAVAVCLLYEDIGQEKAAKYIETATDYFSWYLDFLNTSGNHEGLMYTSYSVEYMMVAFDVLNRVLGIGNLINHEYLNDFLMDWLVAGSENTHCMTFNIGDSWTSGGFDVTASVLNKQNHNGIAGYYLNKSHRGNAGFDGFIYHVDDLYIEQPDRLQSVFLDRVGWGSMRTGWGDTDSVFVCTASRSKQYHNHYDDNSFMIAINGTFIATDPGYQDYSQSANGTYTLYGGHSTLYVDGKYQYKKGYASMVEKMTTPFLTYFIGSAGNSFVTNQKMTMFDRTFMLVNHAESPYYLIMDNIASDKEHVYTWRINVDEADTCELNGETAKLGVLQEANFAKVSNDKATMGISFADTGNINMKYYKYANMLGKLIDVTTNESRPTQQFLSVITPTSGNELSFNFPDLGEKALLSDDSLELSTITAEADGMLLFKPQDKGDYYELPLNVGISGNYNLTFKLAKANLYGTAKFYINGEYIGEYDSYVDDYLDFEKVSFENVLLKKGDNVLRVESDGSSAGNDTSYIGIVSLAAKCENADASIAKVKETVYEDNVLGAVVGYGVENAQSDLVLFSLDGGAIDKNGLSTDGIEAAVYDFTEEGINGGYSAVDATKLTYNGQTLFECPDKVSVAVSYENDGSAIVSGVETTARLTVPNDGRKLYVNGEEVAVESDVVEVSLAAGENTIQFIALEDGSNGIGANTVILIVCAGVILLAIIALAVLLVKNKKKDSAQ